MSNGQGPNRNSSDATMAKVSAWLRSASRIEAIGRGIRLAIDWVIDGARTRRFSLEQVDQSEKLYLGNRVEHEVLHELALTKNLRGIDTTIEDIDVDLKYSMTTNWMIPPEGVGELCILLSADDARSVYSVGVFRASPEYLGRPNRDGKRAIRAAAIRDAVEWIARDAPLKKNFLLHLDAEVRDAILSETSGQSRVTQAFRLVLDQPISAVAIDTLAVQRDPSKRVRDARDQLISEGIRIYCGRWQQDRDEVTDLGLPHLKRDEWLSTRRT